MLIRIWYVWVHQTVSYACLWLIMTLFVAQTVQCRLDQWKLIIENVEEGCNGII
jgi:hypothetical protein